MWKFVFYINKVVFKNELTRITIKISRRSVASNDVDQLSTMTSGEPTDIGFEKTCIIKYSYDYIYAQYATG